MYNIPAVSCSASIIIRRRKRRRRRAGSVSTGACCYGKSNRNSTAEDRCEQRGIYMGNRYHRTHGISENIVRRYEAVGDIRERVRGL